jgi:hypothetical protein
MDVDAPDDAPASPGDRHPRVAAPPADAADGAPLRAVVVRYEASPDRRTLYPAGATETERLTRWLSADADAFVSLERAR